MRRRASGSGYVDRRSWDVFIMRFPPEAESIDQIADDWNPRAWEPAGRSTRS